MLTAYPACFFKETNGYSVIFPDLNLATCGKTLDEALKMAVDCLAGYLYTLEKGEKAPEPSAVNKIDPAVLFHDLNGNEPLPDELFVNMITVDVAEYAKTHFEKSVKKTLTIPAWLNKAALDKGINFSAVLQNALKEQLGL